MGSDLSDEILLSRIINGESELYRHLITRYKNKVFSIGYNFFRNREDAEDLTQESFIRCYEVLPSIKSREKFRSYLAKIAWNLAITWKKRRVADTVPLDDYQLTSLPENYERREITAELDKALSALPAKYRICVELSFYWSMQYREISSLTEIPENTIKSHIFRAKSILFNALKGTIAEEYDEHQ